MDRRVSSRKGVPLEQASDTRESSSVPSRAACVPGIRATWRGGCVVKGEDRRVSAPPEAMLPSDSVLAAISVATRSASCSSGSDGWETARVSGGWIDNAVRLWKGPWKIGNGCWSSSFSPTVFVLGRQSRPSFKAEENTEGATADGVLRLIECLIRRPQFPKARNNETRLESPNPEP